MKKKDYSHIGAFDCRSNLLMFVETMDELLFYYSFESYKLPALNTHFLCLDILKTKEDIDTKKINEGNFVPLAEEFEKLISKDIVLRSYLPTRDILLEKRDKDGKIVDYTKLDNKGKLNKYIEVIAYIAEKNEVNNTYQNTLFRLLEDSIFCKENNYFNLNNIYQLTRSLATELVNGGYSPEYIRYELNEKFISPQNKIEGNQGELKDFLDQFSFEEKTFKIYLGINKETEKILNFIGGIEIDEPTGEIRKKINLKHKGDKVIVIEVKELDKFRAARKAYNIITTFIALYRISQHNRPLYIKPKVFVLEFADIENGEKDNTVSKGSVDLNENILLRANNESQVQSSFFTYQLMSENDVPYSFFQAVNLHNSALDSKEPATQLLDLWSVLEILIEVKVSDHDKISSICNVLTCILCRTYLYNHIEQLYKDLNAILSEEFVCLLDEISGEENAILRLTKLLSVKNYSGKLLRLHGMLEEYPLLQYRLKNFSDSIFCDSKSVYEELIRHKMRLKWQIMRIYRNRNMITHNGKYMPYLSVILGNLHYYVDSLLDVLMEYYMKGFCTNHLIYLELEKKELQHWKILGLDKKGQEVKQKDITEENFKEIIFNGYEGNEVKNIIRKAINETY